MEPTFDQMIVALGTPPADGALIRHAATLACLGRTEGVRFVHVARAGADAGGLRRALQAHVAATAPSLAALAQFDVLQGALSDRLLAYVDACQADLVVVGGRRRKLAARLAMVAPSAVAVLPDGAAPSVSHLLVAVDFSHDAADTLRWATRLVVSDPAIRCTALHVMTHESTDLFASAESDEARLAQMRALLREAGRPGVTVVPHLAPVRRVAEVGGRYYSLAASIQGSDVAQTILDEAAATGADCIVMSTRGRSRSASILLGSVAEKVIERTPLPLLVGKPAGRRLGLVDILLGRATTEPALKTS